MRIVLNGQPNNVRKTQRFPTERKQLAKRSAMGDKVKSWRMDLAHSGDWSAQEEMFHRVGFVKLGNQYGPFQ